MPCANRSRHLRGSSARAMAALTATRRAPAAAAASIVVKLMPPITKAGRGGFHKSRLNERQPGQLGELLSMKKRRPDADVTRPVEDRLPDLFEVMGADADDRLGPIIRRAS